MRGFAQCDVQGCADRTRHLLLFAQHTTRYRRRMMRRKQVRRVALGGFPVAVPWVALLARGMKRVRRGTRGLDHDHRSAVADARRIPVGVGYLHAEGLAVRRRYFGHRQSRRGAGSAPTRHPRCVHVGSRLQCGFAAGQGRRPRHGTTGSRPSPGARLRHLAYCGTTGIWYSEQRGVALAERAREAGVSCDITMMPKPTNSRTPWHRRWRRWIAGCNACLGRSAC